MTPNSDSAQGEQVHFQLVLPPGLGDELSAIPNVTVEQTGEAPERVQHELAIEAVATVLSIAVHVKDLLPTCRLIAEHIHR